MFETMSLRVLLADDSPRLIQTVKPFLEQEGFDVVGEAGDGRRAVDLARAHHPDVAVLDLVMPRMTGLEAADEIRQLSPGTGVLVLTAHCEEYQVLAALRGGVRGYVVKSRVAEDLPPAIREVAEGRVYLSLRASQVVVEAYLSGLKPPTL